ncbi:MAG: hypothetical protein KDA60_03590 [Planctomycetales bacterium]|nr:hypothetical protein [Planctomycetales bacterium]
MMKARFLCFAVFLGAGLVATTGSAETLKLSSIGPMAFGPDGVLFISDPMEATIHAVQLEDQAGNAEEAKYEVDDVRAKVAGMLGASAENVVINDLAVSPQGGNVYLAVTRGSGDDAASVVVQLTPSGDMSLVDLENAKFTSAKLPNPVDNEADGRGRNQRMESITDLAFVDGRVFIAGLSNEEFSSKLRAIAYPFNNTDEGTSVEVFHGAHGRFETRSPVRTFAPYEIEGQAHLLAAYTCTPLVKFPVDELKPGDKVRGITVAELGNRNRPLDMFIYNKDGKDYVLMANSSRGVMKITTEEIGKQEGITERISGTAGLTYDTIEELKGVVQLDRLNSKHAVALVQADDGTERLQTIALP